MTEKTMTEKISYSRCKDYNYFIDALDALVFKYPFIKLSSIGESIMGKRIPVITLGENISSRGVLYLGGVSALDKLTTALLTRFISDYADFLSHRKRIYSVSIPYLYECRAIHIIPMLNPDGAEIRASGVADSPIADRVRSINGSDDYSNWRGNARGVDLTTDFFTQNEPESSALCSYLKIFSDIEALVSLGIDSDGMKISSGEAEPPRSRTIARLLSRMSGCSIEEKEKCRCTGTAEDYFIRTMNRPAFGFGLGGGDISGGENDGYIGIYAAIREALFTTPILI